MLDENSPEMCEFFKLGKTKSKEIRDKLVVEHLYIAEIVAKKFANKGIEYDDLYQVASLALLKAIDRYDPSKGFKFASFATPTVIGEVKNYFRDKSRIIRLPRRRAEQLQKMREVKVNLYNKLGYTATPGQIAKAMGVSLEEVLEIMEANSAVNVISIDSQYEDSDLSVLDGIKDEETNYASVENRDFIQSVISKFNSKEREFIYRRYTKEESQRTIAQAMGVSQMYISRLEKKVLQQFKQYVQN